MVKPCLGGIAGSGLLSKACDRSAPLSSFKLKVAFGAGLGERDGSGGEGGNNDSSWSNSADTLMTSASSLNRAPMSQISTTVRPLDRV